MMSVLALVAVSCEPENKGRDDEPDVPVVNEAKTISSIRYVDCVYGSESMTDFVYDGQGRVISIETDDGYGSYAVNVVYSGNEVTVTSALFSDYVTELVYELDDAGKAVSMSTFLGDELELEIEFSYNQDGSMSSLSVMDSYVVDYVWEDGNLVTAVARLMGYEIERGDRTYTDIPNDTNLDLNSLICMSDFSGSITNMDYDGEILGIYGKTSSCMMSSDVWDYEDMYEYEYGFDGQGRISEIDVYYSDGFSERELEGKYYIDYVK